MNRKLIQLTQIDENGVKIITPKNILREKAGFGGLDKVIIDRAEDHIRTNDINFQYPASDLLKQAMTAIETAQSRAERDRGMIEIICKPVTQLKAGGEMFRYPLLTRISNIMLGFLDDRESLDEEAFDILNVYIRIIGSILDDRVTGDGDDGGRAQIREMAEACLRYSQKYASREN